MPQMLSFVTRRLGFVLWAAFWENGLYSHTADMAGYIFKTHKRLWELNASSFDYS